MLGKILGGVILGVGAVAAAPFTGGGSILAAASLGASLAGAGTIAAAAGAGVAGAAAGAYLGAKEKSENQKKDEKISEQNLKLEKLESELKKVVDRCQGDKEYFNFIIGTTALGIAMANADGKICDEERKELAEFVGGISNSEYPLHIKDKIASYYENPPSLNTALQLLEGLNYETRVTVRELLEVIAHADGIKDESEKAFLVAFDKASNKIEYVPEANDNQREYIG